MLFIYLTTRCRAAFFVVDSGAAAWCSWERQRGAVVLFDSAPRAAAGVRRLWMQVPFLQ